MKVVGTDNLHWLAFAVPFASRSVVVADPLLLNSNTSPNGTGALCVVATAPVTRSVAILKHLIGPVRWRVIDDTEACNDNLREFKSFCN